MDTSLYKTLVDRLLSEKWLRREADEQGGAGRLPAGTDGYGRQLRP